MSAAPATAKSTASAKKITVQGTAGTRHAEYNPISDSYLRTNPKSVLTALIHGMNAHCADMLITMLDIMADKYGHDTNDLIDAVKGDARWKAVTAHPILNSLGYFDQEDADRVIGKKTAAATTAEDLHDEVKPAKVAKPALVEGPEVTPAASAPTKPKKTTKKAAAVETVVENITHAEAYGYGNAEGDELISGATEPEVAELTKPKKTTKKATAPEEEAEAEVAAAPPSKPKKTTKKAVAAVEEEAAPEVKPKKSTKKAVAAVEEEAATPEPKPKKATKKAVAAAEDAVVDALTESVAMMTTEEAEPAPAKKKVISKKPVVKPA